MKKFTAILLSVIMCLSLTFSVSAATVSKVTHKSPQYGGGNATVFYVNAKNTKSTSISYSSNTCALVEKNGAIAGYPSHGWKPGYFEIQIWGRNKTGAAWNYISKTNIKSTSGSLSMKGYTQYKVRVYAWKTSTIGKTLGGRWDSSAYWWESSYAPTCTFKAKSNVSHLAK